ncbi:MAG TPA: SRPBCC family protein [Thermodesulfovibrionales bacterium]|nr:SRPBCC family protein [Thermodesulfovibrionales bacterium]
MLTSCKNINLPADFRIVIRDFEKGYRLDTFLSLAVPRDKAFVFFQNPQNLFDITPEWLDFRMVADSNGEKVFEGAEYDYHIRWCGLTLKWRSRIQTYNPPYNFTDIQIVGPYAKWEHSHRFKEQGETTLMFDTVVYELPLSCIGRAVHAIMVKKQLKDIFCYRALKVIEWVNALKNEYPL